MKTCIALLGIALAACTNGQGQVDVASTNVATFPGASPALSAQQLAAADVTTDSIIELDVHQDLDTLANLGALTGAVSRNAVSGSDLSFVRHIRATIATDDKKLPVQVLSDADVPEDSVDIELPRLISDDTLVEYLKEGTVAIHLTLTGNIPQRPVTLTHTLIAHLDVAVQRSLAKF